MKILSGYIGGGVVCLCSLGCVAQRAHSVDEQVYIAIPSGSNASAYWPDYDSVKKLYGAGKEAATEYGCKLTYRGIPGCDSMVIFFETDAEAGAKKMASKTEFVKVPSQSKIFLGGGVEMQCIRLSYRYSRSKSERVYGGIGSSVIVRDEGITKFVTVYWDS